MRVEDDTAVLEDGSAAELVRPSSLRHSSSLVASSFGGTSGNLGKKMASAMTVSYHFRHQLDDLMSTLRATHPHYIKCIKPNTMKAPNTIMAEIVMEQLRYDVCVSIRLSICLYLILGVDLLNLIDTAGFLKLCAFGEKATQHGPLSMSFTPSSKF